MTKNKPQQSKVEKISQNQIFNSKWAIIIVILLLLFSAFIYYAPSFNEKSLPAHDLQQGVAMATQLADLYKETGEYAKWAINSFSGMPSFQIWISYENLSSWLSVLIYNHTNAYIFISLFISICSAILFYSIGTHPIIIFIGGISLIFSNFTVISLMAGHNNKVMVMSIVPLTLAGIWLLYERKKYIIALFLISLSIALQVRLNHVQITYFMIFFVGVWSLFNFFYWTREKDFRHLILSFIIMALGISLGAINNSTQLLANKEYSEETQRGGPSKVELAKNPEQIESDGVGYEYATAWSYGILESFTLLIPNFSGGPDPSGDIDESNEVAKVLIANGVPVNNAIQVAKQLPTYWGSQPFVAGTTYIGSIIIFLMFLGFFILNDRKKWWLIGSFIITLFLAWGDNFSIFYKFLFNYLPYFNKFRTPSMVFYLTTIIVAITAALTLQKFVQQSQDREMLWSKFFRVSLGFIGFMLIITVLGSGIFSFSSPELDTNIKAQLLQMTQNNVSLADAIMGGLIQERKSMMRADSFRSLVLILLTAIAIAAFLKRKISAEIMLSIIAVLILIDIVGVDKRYVNHDTFVDNALAGIDGPIPTEADRFILQDTTQSYRILDLTVNSFSDAKPSYFHKNIGGYHSVKLKRYQDILTYLMNQNIQELSKGNITQAQILNMLNTKYIITSNEARGVYKNEQAFGNAWLIDKIKIYNGPVEVFDQLMNENLSKTALLEQPTQSIPQDKQFEKDSNAYIRLIKFSNDELIYSYSSSYPSYAVFSEIYYNNGKGWSAYIDGVHADHDQVNYILRGLNLPAGHHEISFKFDSPTLKTTAKIDLASSFIIILIGLGAVITFIRDNRKQKI